jgi:hypothetical protein
MKNPVAEIKTENPVRDIKGENLARPTTRQTPARATRPQRHPIYDRPKPPHSNALVVVLGVIFWPIALALYVLKNSTANRFRP